MLHLVPNTGADDFPAVEGLGQVSRTRRVLCRDDFPEKGLNTQGHEVLGHPRALGTQGALESSTAQQKESTRLW